MPATPLRSAHEALGARFTDFGGWKMPLQYEGIIAEHMAVRQDVGVFDVTHLGRFELSGPGATAAIRSELCNDISNIGPGQAQYTMALNGAGGVVDDIIVWRLAEDDYWIMPNGINYDDLLARFEGVLGTTLQAVQTATVLLAVQGPRSPEVLEEVIGVVPSRFHVGTGTYQGGPMWYAGTGYTGERGAEIAVPIENGTTLLEELVAAGATPCGLGARDTLRLEMGYPLWGQDLSEKTSPLEAGLSWVVDWGHNFVGKPALLIQADTGLKKKLVAFRTGDRRPPRHGYEIRAGASIGIVSSGNYSPMLGVGIGMGYLSPPPAPGAAARMDVRGNWVDVELVSLPFLDRTAAVD
jgi:aminomethyltransferase